MDDLETRLRASFSHQVGAQPALLDLPDTIVRRGRRVRRRRTGVVAASLVLVAVVEAAALAQRGGTTARPGPVATAPTPLQTTTQAPPVAPASWVAGLTATKGTLATTALLGDRALFPGAATPVAGVPQVVNAATPVAAGVLLSSSPGEGTVGETSRLQVLSSNGDIRTVATDVGYGHAVDPTGNLVAYGGSQADGKDYVRDIATGRVVHSIQLHDRSGSGSPFGWVGDEVLMTTGDGGAVFTKAWNVVTGKVRTIGRAVDQYFGGYGNVVGADLVALRQGDGTCVAVSHLDQTGDVWSTCDDGYVGFSPGGAQILLGGQEGVQPSVRFATTGGSNATLALPTTGVLSLGWSDETHVAAVVRVPGDAVKLVTCPVDGSACSPVLDVPDVSRAWVVNARR